MSSTASLDKKRKRPTPSYFAVRVGRKPGIYFSWADCQEQIKEFSGASYKKFTNYADAEDFQKRTSAEPTAAATPSASKPSRLMGDKWYGVQRGHKPGVYTDYDEVKRQVTGYPKAYQKKFASREEAQAFVDGATGTTSAHARLSAAPSLNEYDEFDNYIRADECAVPNAIKPGESVLKRQKRNDGLPVASAPHVDYHVDYEPGTGPLPPDAEDGFDRTVTLRPATGLVEYKTEEELSARKWQPTGESNGTLLIYTDGAAPKNGKAGAYAGVGVYFGPGNPNNVSDWLGAGRQTNQRAELAAVRRAVDIAPIDRKVLIKSDSHYAIQCLTTWFQKWRNNDWKNALGKPVENRDLIEPILERIHERELAGATTKFEWVKGHNNDPGNEAADRLAVAGAEKGRQILASQAAQSRRLEGAENGEAYGQERGWSEEEDLRAVARF